MHWKYKPSWKKQESLGASSTVPWSKMQEWNEVMPRRWAGAIALGPLCLALHPPKKTLMTNIYNRQHHKSWLL